MLKIAIIGCGQIGSRHLQSLANLEESALIYLVDNSSDAIEVAINRFNGVLSEKLTNRFELKVCNLNEIDHDLDVAIVATGSKVRAQITRMLLDTTCPKHIIFEKFLFQLEADYKEIASLLSERNINAWVNEWMSSSYAFQRIANWLKDDGAVSLEVDGIEWGMACNSVHFIDLFDYFNGRRTMSIDTYEFDDGMPASKRPGYYELTGNISIISDNNAILRVVCKRGKPDGQISIKIKSLSKSIHATLTMDTLKCDLIENGSSHKEEFTIAMQSEMTRKIVQSLALSGMCDLPSYERSSYHHFLVLDCFTAHFRGKCGWSEDRCPVT